MYCIMNNCDIGHLSGGCNNVAAQIELLNNLHPEGFRKYGIELQHPEAQSIVSGKVVINIHLHSLLFFYLLPKGRFFVRTP